MPARQGRVRGFQERVARAYPRRELQAVVDNYESHEPREVHAWLAKNPHIALHFTPTSGSRLNLVEVLFGNQLCHLFTWTKTADENMSHAS